MRFAWLLSVLLLAPVTAAGPSVSKWAYLGPDHRMHYETSPRGDRIMDFSHAGYRGGGARPPLLLAKAAARYLHPIPGDNTSQIQAAIDAVSKLPLDDDGYRGAVQLGSGIYEVAGTLNVAADGVVLRGMISKLPTSIRLTGPPHRFLEIRGSGSWQEQGDPAKITDAYVPSGADSFQVDRPQDFHVGDAVLIRKPVTDEWVHFMGMDTLVRDGKKQTWIRPGTLIRADRIIKSVSGNRITLDVPLSDSLDSKFLGPDGATMVKYTFPGRIRNVAVGFMHVSAPATDVPITGGQYAFLRLDAVSDVFVMDIRIDETQNGIVIGPSARRVTMVRVSVRHTLSHSGSAAPADFSISGTQILLDSCSVSGQGTWPVVTQATVTGPNVVLHFHADQAGVSPHQRWATGLLVDSSEFRNNTARRPGIAFSNRKTAGSGHGWDIGWAVAWNVTSDFFLLQQPPGAINWCIGCLGKPVPDNAPGTFDSTGHAVDPPSLYIQQLQDRRGSR